MPLPFCMAGGGSCAVFHFLARDGLRVCPPPLNCQAMGHESVRIAFLASDGLKIPTFFLGNGVFSFVYFNPLLAGLILRSPDDLVARKACFTGAICLYCPRDKLCVRNLHGSRPK